MEGEYHCFYSHSLSLFQSVVENHDLIVALSCQVGNATEQKICYVSKIRYDNHLFAVQL